MEIVIGSKMFWLDPDDGICSSWVEVVSVNGSIVTVKGKYALIEVIADELYPHEV
jgi:hypothetical protein